jgi:hypothetical protein
MASKSSARQSAACTCGVLLMRADLLFSSIHGSVTQSFLTWSGLTSQIITLNI